MINVEEIFKSVKELARKDKAGYVDSSEFNRMSYTAEMILFKYYLSSNESMAEVGESLSAFIKEATLPLDAFGRATVPSDFAHRLNVYFKKAKSGATCADDTTFEEIWAKYLEQSEIGLTISSPLRRPYLSKNRIYWTFGKDGKIQMYPKNIKPSIVLSYLRYPTPAVRGFSVDATNDEENYNAGASTHYEWDDSDRQNIIDLILFQIGIVTGQNDVVQFASQRSLISSKQIA